MTAGTLGLNLINRPSRCAGPGAQELIEKRRGCWPKWNSPNGALLAGRIHWAELELINGARHRHVEAFRGVESPLVLKFL
jgi:hypothetical protein